jgi:hypothetical protein
MSGWANIFASQALKSHFFLPQAIVVHSAHISNLPLSSFSAPFQAQNESQCNIVIDNSASSLFYLFVSCCASYVSSFRTIGAKLIKFIFTYYASLAKQGP